MDWRAHIEVNPKGQHGRPMIRGTGLSVEFIMDLLAEGWDATEIVVVHPGVTVDDIYACLAFASDILKNLKAYPYTID